MSVDQSLSLRTDTVFDRVILGTATVMFALTIVLVGIQVVVRNLNVPVLKDMVWIVPASRVLLILGTYLGAAVVTRNQEHIAIGIVADKVGALDRRAYVAIRLLVMVGVLVFLLVALWAMMVGISNDWDTPFGGNVLLSEGQMLLGISFGLAIMVIYELQTGIGEVRDALSDGTDE